MEGIKSNVLEKKDCEAKVSVIIDAEIVLGELEVTFEKISKEAHISGFRKGKAPLNLVKENYGSRANQELINSLVPKAIQKVLEKEELDPVVYPEISDFSFKDDKSIEFKLCVETRPEFVVKDYKNLKIQKQKVEITEKDVEGTLDYLRNTRAKLVKDSGDEIKKDSFVVFDYEGKIGGEPFEGGKEDNSLISIEKSHFVPGFAEQLIGLKINEEKDVKVTFPKDYQKEELREKEAVFHVLIKELKKKEMPALDDEFVKSLGEKDIDSLKQKIKEQMLSEKKNKVEAELKDDIVNKILNKNEIKVPKTVVKNQLENMVNQMKQYLAGQKGVDENAIREKYKSDAEKQVKAAYILNAIALKENLIITDDEFNKEIEKAIGKSKDREKEIKEYFAKNKSNICHKMEQDKVFDFIKANAAIKEK